MRPWLCVAIVLLEVQLPAPLHAEPAELPGFPVRLAGGMSESSGVLVSNLETGGPQVIVTTVGESLFVVEGSGQIRAGFPISLHDAVLDANVSLVLPRIPSACDLQGDGDKELILAGSNHRLFAFTGHGQRAPGFPVLLDGVSRGPVACLPTGSGRTHDLLLTVDNGHLMRVSGGGGSQKIRNLQRGSESGVALADLDNNNQVQLVVGGGDSALHVLDAFGEERTGFPYKMTFRSTGVPALADINDDGKVDIIVASEDYRIHALDSAGKPLPGFPVTTGYRLYAGVCVGDVDGDGVMDVAAASGDGKLYVVNGRGQILPGFPVDLQGRSSTACVMADFDKDGKQDVVAVSQGGYVHVIRYDGSELPEFPWRVGSKLEIAPAVADLNNDGLPDLIVQERSGRLHALAFAASGTAPKALIAWPVAGHDAASSGRFGPTPARYKDLSFAVPAPLTTDPLTAHYRYVNLDGGNESNTQLRWVLNDVPQSDLDNRRTVPPERTTKHQRWYYTVQEGVNFDAYGPSSVLSYVFKSPVITIGNTPPSVPRISLLPATPVTTDMLDVTVVQPSSDADNDSLTYRYRWQVDRHAVDTPLAATRIDAAVTEKHQEWQVAVTAYDGEVESAPAFAAVTVRNTSPGAADIKLIPATPRTDDALNINIVKAGVDNDGDKVSYRYHVTVDGNMLGLPENQNIIPTRVLHKHARVQVEVVSWDDEVAGSATNAETRISNTPPTPPTLAIWPPHPRKKDNLVLAVTAQPQDSDGDLVILKHQWLLDGAKVDQPTMVPSALLKKGQVWRLDVTPFDGEVDGPPVSAQTTVENTPPTAPLLVLNSYTPFTDETVVPRILAPASDDDNDAVTLHYQWSCDGNVRRDFPESQATLSADDTHKGQVWDLTATPFDGTALGLAVHLRWRIINSPPSAPVITVSNALPTNQDRVEVKVVTHASDKDNDALSYRSTWWRDGVQVLPRAPGNMVLEPNVAHKGEHWRVDVRAFDGEIEGTAASVDFRVQNHVPQPPTVTVTPALPRITDALHCNVVTPGTDADGDALSYRIRWLLNGHEAPLAWDQNALPPGHTREGQLWQCQVAAFDGTQVSTAQTSAAVTVVNSVPTAPVLAIIPVMPMARDDLFCGLLVPSRDADNDVLTYRYTWKVDGKDYPAAPGAANQVPHSALARGQVWGCSVTASDGKAVSGAGQISIVVGDTAPTMPRLVVHPEGARAGQQLRCDMERPSSDIDGDTIRYTYAWYKDGRLQPFAGSSMEVPARLVNAHDSWHCSATPSDGSLDGPPGFSSTLVVRAADGNDDHVAPPAAVVAPAPAVAPKAPLPAQTPPPDLF